MKKEEKLNAAGPGKGDLQQSGGGGESRQRERAFFYSTERRGGGGGGGGVRGLAVHWRRYWWNQVEGEVGGRAGCVSSVAGKVRPTSA